MKSIRLAALAILVSGTLGGFALSRSMADGTIPAAPSTQPAANAAPVNAKCPVSGDPVDPHATSTIYKGKVIGFCCSDCVKEFNKDPDKYASKIK